MKTIEVYRYAATDDYPPFSLIDRIAWLQAKLDEVPDEFRKSARVAMEASEEYGDVFVEYSISYIRPETAEERAAEERIDAERQVVAEQLERGTLARLLAKYPSTS